jgi:acetolactate synthase I/III small subunit
MRHIISILLQNEAGALARVAAMFSTRGYNIESLSVAATENPLYSRLTLVTIGSDQVIDQINKQLLKLVDVVTMADMTQGDHIERELLLIKVDVSDEGATRIRDLVKREGALVLDDNPGNYTVELTSTCGRIDEFVEKLSSLAKILTVARSGPMAISRGPQVLSASA